MALNPVTSTFGGLILKGDIMELGTDRSEGKLRMRVFRNQKWYDLGSLKAKSNSKSGDLYFVISTTRVGNQITIVDKPIEWPTKS